MCVMMRGPHKSPVLKCLQGPTSPLLFLEPIRYFGYSGHYPVSSVETQEGWVSKFLMFVLVHPGTLSGKGVLTGPKNSVSFIFSSPVSETLGNRSSLGTCPFFLLLFTDETEKPIEFCSHTTVNTVDINEIENPCDRRVLYT